MKIRSDLVATLVLAFAAAALVGVGAVLSAQASFASDYTRQQLGDQKITFAAADRLSDADRNWKPGSACLVEYAGQPLLTGRQAECYANYYIAAHMAQGAERAGYAGHTFATLGAVQGGLRADVAAARTRGDQTEIAAAQKKLDDVNGLRDMLFRGDMLRSALLSVYGFSVIGSVAEMTATAAYVAAAVLLILALAVLLIGQRMASQPRTVRRTELSPSPR